MLFTKFDTKAKAKAKAKAPILPRNKVEVSAKFLDDVSTANIAVLHREAGGDFVIAGSSAKDLSRFILEPFKGVVAVSLYMDDKLLSSYAV